MSLTTDDLNNIQALLEGSERRLGERIAGVELRLSAKIDAVRADIVEDVTGVLNESLGMISDQITRLDKRIDSLRIVAGP